LPSPCATAQVLAGWAELGMRQVLGAAGRWSRSEV